MMEIRETGEMRETTHPSQPSHPTHPIHPANSTSLDFRHMFFHNEYAEDDPFEITLWEVSWLDTYTRLAEIQITMAASLAAIGELDAAIAELQMAYLMIEFACKVGTVRVQRISRA